MWLNRCHTIMICSPFCKRPGLLVMKVSNTRNQRVPTRRFVERQWTHLLLENANKARPAAEILRKKIPEYTLAGDLNTPITPGIFGRRPSLRSAWSAQHSARNTPYRSTNPVK